MKQRRCEWCNRRLADLNKGTTCYTHNYRSDTESSTSPWEGAIEQKFQVVANQTSIGYSVSNIR